jgi:solute carrier family 36 (proton-coupled amino acid transporter)
VAYLVFIGQNISSIFASGGWLSAATVVLALLLPVQAALSFVRSLSSLGHFSILADACTVLAVTTVVNEDVRLLAARSRGSGASRSRSASRSSASRGSS